MTDEGRAPQPMRKKSLLLATAGAGSAGLLIVLGAILPAEFNLDPLGIGKLTGIIRLWAEPAKTIDPDKAEFPLAREFPAPFRTDVVEIPLTGFLGGAKGSELEYKVFMKTGASLVYAWEVLGADNIRDFHYDFHGHTLDEGTVATYKQSFGLKQQGALTSAFDGIQGWQFSNSSEGPVVVRVRLAGYYDLIPPGQDGNLAGIIANVPAAQARPNMPPAPATK